MQKEKRKSKSQTLFDIDDLQILELLQDAKNKLKILTLGSIKEKMNFSHNALLVHLRRLDKNEFIHISRFENEQYKTKFVEITTKGKKVYELFNDNNKLDSNSLAKIIHNI